MAKSDETVRFSVSLPGTLLSELDERMVRQGYASRSEFVRDLIVRVLSESPGALEVRAIRDRVNHLHMGRITLKRVRDDLSDLESTGHVLAERGQYQRTRRPYVELDLDVVGLRALAGPELHDQLSERGFVGLRDVDGQPHSFVPALNETAGWSSARRASFLSRPAGPC